MGDPEQIYFRRQQNNAQKLPDNSVDPYQTSPPYADQRRGMYGGIHPDKYVEWVFQ